MSGRFSVRIGDLVSSPSHGVMGIVISFLDLGYPWRSYHGTVKVVDVSGGVITLDVHSGDEWELIS